MPAYTFPENREDLAVLRVVCRNGFSLDLADLFFKDLLAAVDNLNEEAGAAKLSGPSGFRHDHRSDRGVRTNRTARMNAPPADRLWPLPEWTEAAHARGHLPRYGPSVTP